MNHADRRRGAHLGWRSRCPSLGSARAVAIAAVSGAIEEDDPELTTGMIMVVRRKRRALMKACVEGRFDGGQA